MHGAACSLPVRVREDVKDRFGARGAILRVGQCASNDYVEWISSDAEEKGEIEALTLDLALERPAALRMR